MAEAEINIWNINPSKKIPQKDSDIYQEINTYIDKLPFSSVKKSYLKKIYLGISQPPFWKHINDKISSDFMTLESKLSTIQDMRESEFSSIYQNNYPTKHFNKELIKKISTDSPAIIKKLVIQDLIEKSELSERYKNYLIKMKVNFSNYLHDKIIASNDFEVTGASVVDEKQALNSAIANLEERINKEGILKTLGIY